MGLDGKKEGRMPGYSVLILIIAALALFVGIMLLFGWWNPYSKKEEAEGEEDEGKADTEAKDEIYRIKRITVGGFFITMFISFVSLFFVTNPGWIKRLREKHSV